jgi:hypothetical protein
MVQASPQESLGAGNFSGVIDSNGLYYAQLALLNYL